MQVAANVGVVDSLEVAAPDVFTPTPAITTSSGMISTTSITTIASGSTTSITTTPTNCSNLGTIVGMSTMIGCADYTKGTINLTVSGTSNYLYSVIK